MTLRNLYNEWKEWHTEQPIEDVFNKVLVYDFMEWVSKHHPKYLDYEILES